MTNDRYVQIAAIILKLWAWITNVEGTFLDDVRFTQFQPIAFLLSSTIQSRKWLNYYYYYYYWLTD